MGTDRKTIERKLAELDVDDLTPIRGVPVPIDVHHVNERVKMVGLESRRKMAVLARELDAQNEQYGETKTAIEDLDACVDRRFDKLNTQLQEHHTTISKRIDDQNTVALAQSTKLGEISTLVGTLGAHVSGLVMTAQNNQNAILTIDTAKKAAEESAKVNDEADKKKNRRQRITGALGFLFGLGGVISLLAGHLHC